MLKKKKRKKNVKKRTVDEKGNKQAKYRKTGFGNSFQYTQEKQQTKKIINKGKQDSHRIHNKRIKSNHKQLQNKESDTNMIEFRTTNRSLVQYFLS